MIDVEKIKNGVKYSPTITRATLPIDIIIGCSFPVLDYGFVIVTNYMGTDEFIAKVARVSTGSHNKGPEKDQKLIEYLVRHKHSSPLEFAEIVFHIRLPIFVARQWVRHRTANISEMSGRYAVMREEFYLPKPENVKAQSKTNHQGSDGELDRALINDFIYESNTVNNRAFETYGEYINEGVARETARINLPLSTYTEWYWKIDAHNLMHFLQLRNDPHAQWEIREYAKVIDSIFELWLPMTYNAFKKRVRRDQYAQEHFWNDEDYNR